MLQFERIYLILIGRCGWIVQILFMTTFGGHEGVTRGVARQTNACLSRFALSFHFICSLTLMVDPTEIRDDDRNWKSYDKDTTQTADTTDDFARPSNERTFPKREVSNEEMFLPGFRDDISVSAREEEEKQIRRRRRRRG